MPGAKNDGSQNIFVVITIVGIGLCIAGYATYRFLVVGGPDPGPQIVDNSLTTEEINRLISLKNRALADLENEKYGESDAALAQIADALPQDRLGPRNLLVNRLLALQQLDRQTDGARFDEQLATAEAALELLRKVEQDVAVLHYLTALVVQERKQPAEQLAQLTLAAEADPDNPVYWYAVYAAYKNTGDTTNSDAIAALKQAYELQPDNLFVLVDWLLVQAEAKDASIVATLQAAQTVLQPFVVKIQQLRRVDLNELLTTAIDAADDPDKQAVVYRNVRIMSNLIRPEIASLIDHRRIEPHLLEFVINDFDARFYEQPKYVAPTAPAAIAVTFSPASGVVQLPQVAGVVAVELVDVDLDRRLDVVLLRGDGLQVYSRGAADGWTLLTEIDLPAGMRGFVTADFDRDVKETLPASATNQPQPRADSPPPTGAESVVKQPGCLSADVDFAVYGAAGIVILRQKLNNETERRTLEIVEQDDAFKMLPNVHQLAVADLEHDGDLDLVAAGANGISLWRNRDNMTFEKADAESTLPANDVHAVVLQPVDWNRNVDIDVVIGNSTGSAGVLENLRHGRFRWRLLEDEFAALGNVQTLAVADVDGNASWDLIAGGGQGISVVSTTTPGSGVVRFRKTHQVTETAVADLLMWDYDNDGTQDILAWNQDTLLTYRGAPTGTFQDQSAVMPALTGPIVTCDVGDIDNDGDWDVLVVHPDGVIILINEGGNQNHWTDIALHADINPQNKSERCPIYGTGSLVEVKAGPRYQAQVVSRMTTHFGLGQLGQPDVVRALWTNGIPANVIAPQADEPICERQKLKGSCPYLYTWTGERYEFFTDLLWAAPIGLQFAEGVTARPREWEYLKIPGDRLAAVDGEYRLQITEELWEAAVFDTVQLLAVDHPANVEIFSNEKVGPAEIAEFKIHTVRTPQVPVQAHDQNGRDVLKIIRDRDENYLRAFGGRLKQGLVDEHFLELDLGDLQEPKQIMLYLTGWIFPTDTSINIGLSHNPDLNGPRPPAVWVPDEQGQWRETVPFMGFPGGKTKTIAIDLTQAFLTDDYRLRIVTSNEIYWDQAFFTVDEEPAEVHVQPLELSAADLHFRGFSAVIDDPGYGPDRYDYARVSTISHWPPMDGFFTRFGDVTELLRTADDRMVVLGAGDEMTLKFQVPQHDLPAGWKRDFIIHNVGWDKDADLNTIYGQTVEPLPFRAMNGYPDVEGRQYPDDELHRDYLRDYQTRTQSQAEFWKSIREWRR